MNSVEHILAQATRHKKRILLPESEDPRILEAASILSRKQLAEPILVGSRPQIEKRARSHHIDLDSVIVVDPLADDKLEQYTDILLDARKHKGMTRETACRQIGSPLTFSACVVKSGDADGCVAGAINTTSDVVRIALQIIGMEPENDLVSSFFLMQHALPHQGLQGTAIFADCALVIEPDAAQLATIAINSADSARSLAGLAPKVALLSFSTAGSAQHPKVEKVKEAGHIVSQRRPDIELMPEVQFDAAILPELLKRKAPSMTVRAPANVFIFPDLQSANIGYKIAQRLGGVEAVGPVLQGLARPVNDLSRGCSVDDIVKLVAVTSVQAQTTC